ncbi:hypothetical protein LZK73_12040 [Neorhizobium galegae]|nr:hypothetical protein LZK73_12040 [Neorhizobium galegae]
MGKSEIENMLDWRKRRGQSGATFTLAHDLQRLAALWKSKAEDAQEFADFIPMRLVTIIEVFSREVIRELVDSGSPYLRRREHLRRARGSISPC